MIATSTIFSYEESCSGHRWECPNRNGIAAGGLASFDIGPTWALDRSREM